MKATVRREDDILPYRHLNISAYPDPIQSFHSSLFTVTYSLAAVANARAASPLPYRYLNISSYPNQKQSYHFAVRRNFTPKAHHFPLAENITRRRRISLCNPPQGAVAPRGTAKRGKEPAGMKATICLL